MFKLSDLPTPSGDAGTKTHPKIKAENFRHKILMPQGKISHVTGLFLLPTFFRDTDAYVKIPFLLPTLPAPSSSDRVDLELFFLKFVNPGDTVPTVLASKTISIDDSNAPSATNELGVILFKLAAVGFVGNVGGGDINVVLTRRSDDTLLDDFEVLDTLRSFAIAEGNPGPPIATFILVP